MAGESESDLLLYRPLSGYESCIYIQLVSMRY